MTEYKYQRKMVNMLLQPLVQLRIGAFNLALSLVFVLLLGAYCYQKFVQFTDVVVTLTEADSAVFDLIRGYLSSIGTTALLASLVFVAANIALSIFLTHRLVGPTIAFRRHIKALIEGDYAVRTRLRTGDAFREVADDLNTLSERLEKGR